MAFPPQFLDEIRARVPLATVVGRRVQLKKSGREHQGLCPFHKEKTPSFTVSEDKGFFHCFGCGAHGDVIGFVMQSEGLGFPEAVERLAAEAGLEVPRDRPVDRQAEARRKSMGDALEAAAAWYQAQLDTWQGENAKNYLIRRGVSAETAAAFRLGFAPNQRGALRQALNAKGLKDELLIDAGLLKAADDGGAPRDYFFDRLMFPITDRRDRVIAFGGRALGESKAKYLNSPESAAFHKGRTLYNVPKARRAAHDTGELLVVEGYMDVIALAEHGFPAAVAPLGTAITTEQLGELWRLCREPVLCLDGDSAGRRAALRAAVTALPGLEPGRSLRFAMLPPGEDPDSLVSAQGASALRQVIDQAIGLDSLLWLSETQGRRLDTPERQAEVWKSLNGHIGQIGDSTLQGAYRATLERRFETAFGFNPGRRGPRPFVKQGAGDAAKRSGAVRGGRGPSGLGLQRGAQVGKRRREQVLLACFVNHPLVLVDYAEALAKITFVNKDLADLSKAIIDLTASQPNLDSEGLKCHLSEQGHAEDLARLLDQQVYVHGVSAQPGTPADEVLALWHHLVALQREDEARLETEEIRRRLDEQLTEEGLARLQARQRASEGDESRRVEFELHDRGNSN